MDARCDAHDAASRGAIDVAIGYERVKAETGAHGSFNSERTQMRSDDMSWWLVALLYHRKSRFNECEDAVVRKRDPSARARVAFEKIL